MSGCSAFTRWVRLKIPLTPYDFAQGRLRQHQGERDFESLNCRFYDYRRIRAAADDSVAHAQDRGS